MTYYLTGKQFGWLTVVKKLDSRDSRGKTQWQCLCECGNLKIYTTNELTGSRGAKTCHRCQDHIKRKDAYISWMAAKQRCNDIGHKDYPRYGGRGITFSEEWNEFKVFYKEMGDPPLDKYSGERMSLDRIDNTQGYKPGNCKWSTRFEQAHNQEWNIFKL